MKRVRELELVVQEIVSEAVSKNDQGEFLHPLMSEQNPMVLTFFHASGALLEILINRPLAFLQLLQTNQTLALFWQEFAPNIWILLMERFVEMEENAYKRDIYPFFVIQHVRTYGVKTAASLSFHSPSVIRHNLEVGTASRDPSVRYYVIYYDRFSQRFMDLLRYMLRHEPRFEEIVDLEEALYRYLGRSPDDDSYVACLSDCFLVEQSNTRLLFNQKALRDILVSILLRNKTFNHHTLYLAYSLDEAIFNSTIPSHATPLLLNAETTKAYKDLLFDKELGLYKTSEEQRAFFLTSLRDRELSKEVMVEKYGTLCQ